HQITSRTYGNGLLETRTYDLQGRLKAQDLRNPTGPIEARSYDYDASGNLTRRTRQAENRTYTYDGLDRLVQETLEGGPTPPTDYAHRLARTMGPDLEDTYTFTLAGNRLALIETLQRGSPPPPPALPHREDHYNQPGRLSEVIENGLLQARYAYGAEGQRTRKVLHAGAPVTSTTLYHYDLTGRLLAETREDGTPLRDYLWQDQEPLAQIDTQSGFETLLTLHTDHLQTPRLATGTSGAILWRWEGEAFGSTAPELQSVTVNLRFPGQYFDAETGLHYNYFRDYDPTLGRYIQSGLAGGLNTYEYALNNPIRIYDPFGLEPNQGCIAACTVGGGIIGGGVGYLGGGLLGGGGGTLVAPGVGTIGGAIGGAELGGAAGAAAGSAAGNAAGQALCPDDDDEDKCEKQAQEDEQTCRMATMPGTPARARCWASVQERYGACRAGRPLPPLVIW
ncbi:MAG: RHS repeat domain-containing protein, partial [Gammaproteobacteria bacterium]